MPKTPKALILLIAVVVMASACSGGSTTKTDPAEEVSQAPSSAALYLSDSDAVAMDALAFGILVIEPPCVYINRLDAAGQTMRMPDGKLYRSFVYLPSAAVRFDADTGNIWVGDEGPMTTGDEVTLGGGGRGGSYGWLTVEGDCRANGIWHANSMTLGLDHMLPFGWNDPATEPGELTNMFDWDPAGGFHDSSMSGILKIGPACAHVTDELFVRCVAAAPSPETEPRCVYVTGTRVAEETPASEGRRYASWFACPGR